MITKPDLKKLINRYVTDSDVLLSNRRYASSIYLGGYAVELALKYRICKLLQFGYGYPENDIEFNRYTKGKSRFTGTTIKRVKDLKTHNLSGLLFYSGEQINITTNFLAEWNIIKSWDVFMRYNPAIVRKVKAVSFYNAAKILVGKLL